VPAAASQVLRFWGLKLMRRLLLIAALAVGATLPFSQAALAQRAQYEAVIAALAKIYLVPEELVHRIIIRESKYQASLLGSGGAIGLMQIKLATARGLGYGGNAEGLRDPNTNLTYGIKYLAGAYRAAHGDHNRAVHYYAAGYYMTAKQQRLEHLKEAQSTAASAPPKELSKDQIAAVKDGTTAKNAPAARADTQAAAEPKPEPVPAPQAGADADNAR
jgi:soluble lytic murein transglycosylase-like protein